jgi:hypothetical protein
MANSTDAFGLVIAAALSATPPKTSSTEAAMQKVARGSGATDLESRYFNHFQSEWRKAIAEKDLAGQVLQLIGLYLPIVSRFTHAEKEVGVRNGPVMAAAFHRVREQAEGEILGALVAKGATGATIWLDAYVRHRHYLTQSAQTRDFASRVSKTILEAFATRPAIIAKGTGLSPKELKGLADVQVRAIVLESRQTFLDGAEVGATTWSMPIVDPSRLGAGLSLGNDVSGGIGSALSGVASLMVADAATAAAAAGTAVTLNVVGLVFVAVAGTLAIGAAWESVSSADEAVRAQRLEKWIRDTTVREFSKIADGIQEFQHSLAMVCTIAAIRAGIDLRDIDRANLRRFIWQYMFPRIPTSSIVAVSELVQAEMKARINPVIVGA